MFRTIKRFAAASISLALTLVMLLSLPAWAQNLAEAARQERERRKEQAGAHHVYTNEDLAKPRILVPEDQARAQAHNTGQSSPVIVATTGAATHPGTPPAIDASQPSSPLPVPGVTLASQAPIMLRGPVTVPAPPDSIHAVAASVDVIATVSAQLLFPATDTSAPKASDRRAGKEPEAPYILAPVENAPIGTTTLGVHLPFPVLVAVPTAVPSEPLATQYSAVIPPAIRPASCAGTCPELNGILSTQYAVPVFRSVAEAPSVQPAIVVKPGSVEPQPARANAGGTGVRVEIGDSLWKLAKRYLGDGKHWRELAALNRRLPNPGLIRPGEWIQLPARGPEQARQVVVQPGDTLWTVAETALGSPLAFNCIAHANPQLQSANVIRPGQTLLVPETCAVESAEKDRAGAL